MTETHKSSTLLYQWEGSDPAHLLAYPLNGAAIADDDLHPKDDYQQDYLCFFLENPTLRPQPSPVGDPYRMRGLFCARGFVQQIEIEIW